MPSLSFLEVSAEIYGDDIMKPVCPSVICWTAHEHACLAFFKCFPHILNALIETKVSGALGLIIHASSQIIATILMFRYICPLILSLISLCISEVNTCGNYFTKFRKNSIESEYFTEEVVNNSMCL